MNKLKFGVIEQSGFDTDHFIDNLQEYSDKSSGWRSAPNCEQPQYLILEFDHCHCTRMQFLLHQQAIASKIELYQDNLSLGNERGDSTFFWKYLGFFKPDTNEENDHSARELKSVQVDVKLTHLKIIMQHAQDNYYNELNQVGLINILIYGNPITLDVDEINRKQIELSEKDVDFLRKLKVGKNKAVLAEDFECAKIIKLKIDEFDTVIHRIYELENVKNLAIANEDFDSAKDAKQQMNNLYKDLSNFRFPVDTKESSSLSQREKDYRIAKVKAYIEDRPIVQEPVNDYIMPQKQKKSTRRVEEIDKIQFEQMNEQTMQRSKAFEDQENPYDLESADNLIDIDEESLNDRHNQREWNNNNPVNNDEVPVGGNMDFNSLIEKELQKDRQQQGSLLEKPTQPKKTFLKKGKKVNEIQNSNKKPNGSRSPNKSRSRSPQRQLPGSSAKVVKKPEEDDINSKCMFCNSTKFTSIDQHFLHDCPMITPCKYCGNMIEIKLLSSHYSGECAKSSSFQVCNICNLPVALALKTKHESQCSHLDGGLTRCMLCNKEILNNDQNWSKHLKAAKCRFANK